jgi:hypothetical protein
LRALAALLNADLGLRWLLAAGAVTLGLPAFTVIRRIDCSDEARRERQEQINALTFPAIAA